MSAFNSEGETMIERVYKYNLALKDVATVTMPAGAHVLSVQSQNDRLCLWAKVNPANEAVERYFRIAGTGHELDGNVGSHIATVQVCGGDLVFHVFNYHK